ncbi:MAG: hypothetical protein HY823_13235 [Acidobacteria bacterium]|nr:hypothetical protein [Acidobacteriota bacterium]
MEPEFPMTILRLALTSVLLCLACTAAEPSVQKPGGWSMAEAPKGATLAREAGGLRIAAAPEGSEITVGSSPVQLAVGQLYRLSATIRTEGVRADREARYPTALGACLSMESFPFTNASPQVAGTREQKVELLFLALAGRDRVQLHLGRNGKAWGRAWFRDVRVEKVEDVTAFIPMETVRWAGKGYRYDMGGWIFVHIEGEPYARGRQYGELVASEIVAYMNKLGIQKNAADPSKGWQQIRLMSDALFFRKYDLEYLEEMKGIAEGAHKGGAKFRGRDLDLLDIVALNSVVDADYVESALRVTPSPLANRTFMKGEDEAEHGGKGDHCSSFVATQSATKDGRFVMGQMFMWNGYTGVHWDLMVDVAPAQGHRLVYQTFPGGLHSGADWYINSAGLVIGETTVGQTPFDPEGTPQSNRIRKAAQYASSIDEAAKILTEKNNGLYTNDWTMADAKTQEGACFLLGTKKARLWRTGNGDTPGRLKDFIWANNNNRDLEVRSEYGPNAENAPVDLAFNTWNRDIAFQEAFRAHGKGGFDIPTAARVMASSPINRPHACDAKLTTGEMAEKLMFLAHFGKTTQREKWVGGRWIQDLPGATPHLTLGYTAFSPVWITGKLQAAKASWKPAVEAKAPPRPELGGAREAWSFPRRLLWNGTVLPASDADNWFVSASAAYWQMLRRLPEDPSKAFETLREDLADLAVRHAWLAQREGAAAPAATATAYDRYGTYQIPRIRGLFALHQLRLHLGNATFSRAMRAAHDRFAGKRAGTDAILAALSEGAGRDVRGILAPWFEKGVLPSPRISASVQAVEGAFEVALEVAQAGTAFPFVVFAEIQTEKASRLERLEGKGALARFTLRCVDKPLRLVFNAGHDLAQDRANPFAPGNLLDDWSRGLMVHGTSRAPEAQRSLALQWRDALADNMTEVLLPLASDAAPTDEELKSRDLVILGGPADNALAARMAAEGKWPIDSGPGFFRWEGRLLARPEDGLLATFPNPWNPARSLTILQANSALQLYHMTRSIPRGLPQWALYRGAEVARKGNTLPGGTEVKF